MPNNPFFSDTAIAGSSGALAVICALLNSGKMQILTGTQVPANTSLAGTLLATLTLNATAFGTPTPSGTDGSGRLVTATANSITSGTAGNTGTAGYFALLKSDNATVIMTGSVGTSGADLNLNSLSITSGATVSCSSFTLTQLE